MGMVERGSWQVSSIAGMRHGAWGGAYEVGS